MLPFRQQIHENSVSVRKREGVVVLVRRARNRAKSGNAKACTLGRQPMTIVFDIVLERKFGSWKQTCCDTRLFLRSKDVRRRPVETGCQKHVRTCDSTSD